MARKNLRMVAGRPLVAWSIEEARKSTYVDRLIVSSEDPEIIRHCLEGGCDVPFVRPAELATDESTGRQVMRHAVENLPGYDYLVYLQPTSPLRSATDIDGCIERLIKTGSKTCVSVSETKTHPRWTYWLDDNERLSPVLKTDEFVSQRQQLRKAYVLNGAVYAVETRLLMESGHFSLDGSSAYIMPVERSLDVDTEYDFRFAEMLLKERITADKKST